MQCMLFTYYSGVWHLLVAYPIVYAVLSRLIYDVTLQGNCFGPGLIEVPSTQPYAIIIRRGVTVGPDFLYVDSLKYHISQCDYYPYTGQTHIVADLLPMVATAPVSADIPVHTLLENVFSALNMDDFIYDVSKDIFYNWQFYPSGKLLALKDTRQLSTILGNKYLAYLFPWEDGLHLFNISDLISATVAPPNYTPFSGSIIRSIFTSVQSVNSTWYDADGIVYYNEVSPDAPWHDLGFIKTSGGIVDPREEPDFENWGQFDNAIFYEITTRPDLRIEQGEVMFISADGFVRPRAFEYIEVFKQGGFPKWRQILYEIPLMPWMYQEWFRKYTDKLIGSGFNVDQTQFAYDVRLITDAFNGWLNSGNTQVQSALDTLSSIFSFGIDLPNNPAFGHIHFDILNKTINFGDGDDWYQASITQAYFGILKEDGEHLCLQTGYFLLLDY